MLVLKFVFSVHSVFISAVGLGLALLFFGGFAVDDSSAWHVGLVHIDLFLFGLVPFLAAVQLNFSRMWVWQSLALCTVIALFGIVLMLGWWIGGAPTGFRDERMVPLTAMFVCAGSVGVCWINLIRFTVVIAGKLGVLRRRSAGIVQG